MPERKAKVTSSKESTAKKVETVKEEIKKDAKDLEKKACEVEKKADKTVNELVKKAEFVDKIINASRMKEILWLSFIENANKRVRKNLELICKILWWIALIIWVISTIITAIAFVIALISLFAGGLWLWLFLLSILALLSCALMMILWRWLIKMKKWVPAALIAVITLDLALLVIYILVPGDFWKYLLEVILYIIFTLFVLKNKDMFKN